MNRLFIPIAFAVGLLAYPPLFNTYFEGHTVGVIRGSPANSFPVIAVDTYHGNGPVPDQWHTVDVSHLVPPDTKAIFLTGMLIITHGKIEKEMCGMTVAFRVYGDPFEYPYTAQAGEVVAGAGKRDHYSDWIEINDGKFEFKWRRITTGEWPEHCSYGLNLKVGAYLR